MITRNSELNHAEKTLREINALEATLRTDGWKLIENYIKEDREKYIKRARKYLTRASFYVAREATLFELVSRIERIISTKVAVVEEIKRLRGE